VRRTIMVVASLLVAMGIYAANFALWANRSVVDEDAFVTSAMHSFSLEGSYEALGVVIADKVVDAYPSLDAMRGILVPLFTSLAATEAFRPALLEVSTQIHADVVGGANLPVTIDIAEYEDTLLAAVSLISPTLAAEVPSELFRTFVVFDAQDVPNVSAPARSASTFALFAAVIAIAAGIVLWLGLRSAGSWFVACGLALLLAAIATAILIPAAGLVSNRLVDNDAYRTLGTNLYGELVRSLTTSTVGIAVVGLVFVGLGWLLLAAKRRAAAGA
jgi:hypothetical protein